MKKVHFIPYFWVSQFLLYGHSPMEQFPLFYAVVSCLKYLSVTSFFLSNFKNYIFLSLSWNFPELHASPSLLFRHLFATISLYLSLSSFASLSFSPLSCLMFYLCSLFCFILFSLLLSRPLFLILCAFLQDSQDIGFTDFRIKLWSNLLQVKKEEKKTVDFEAFE